MTSKSLEVVFGLSALIMFPASFVLGMAYAGPEPFFLYERHDAFTHIGVSTAAIAIWLLWSFGVLGLVAAGVFRPRWFLGLLLPMICVFYLSQSVTGYFDDLEHFMLSSEQQKRIGVPVLTE